jgi:hypothetical protein
MRRNAAKIRQSSDELSQWPNAPCRNISDCLISQFVQFSQKRITLHLFVPKPLTQIRKPCGKRTHILRRQGFNFAFEFFELGHKLNFSDFVAC